MISMSQIYDSKLTQNKLRTKKEPFQTLTQCAQVDRLEDELVSEQEKFKAITEELEQTFAEMSGY